MDKIVFYSWQSDLENRFNRSFILTALNKAVRSFSKDENFSINAVVDRDTFGLPGSPSIVEAITNKIARSDVFVCDVSIINGLNGGKPTPNPNVLYELGYASSILGWERILMIQNIAFGGTDKLPFDLRGRRVVTYYLDKSIDEKVIEKEKLSTELSQFFGNALKHYSAIYNPIEKPIWWGRWTIRSKANMRGGELHISRVSSDAFFFEMDLYDGARSGEVSGKAQILTPHSAYAKVTTFDNLVCEFTFRRRLEQDAWIINVVEGMTCKSFHGMGASFSGDYEHRTEHTVLLGYLDEIDLSEIERMMGKFVEVFLGNFQQIHEQDSDNPDLRILTGGVKGLYTIMESIVILDNTGNIWAAFLDPETDSIRYFHNADSDSGSKPKILTDWLSSFPSKMVLENLKGKERP